jgi:Protein of unknown function (DUF4239)
MIFFLTSHSLWLSAALIVVLPTILAALGPSVVRRYVMLDKLTTNNEIAGFKFATVGVLYAVLIGFAIIIVWQKFSDAETDTAAEAGGATAIYRLSRGLDQQSAAALREALSNYITAAINRDWPAMARHATNEYSSARLALDTIYSTLLSSQPSAPRDAMVLPEILRQLDAITQARRARLIAAEGIVPGVLWPILFGSAVVTIAFTFFFGTKNLLAQTAMTVLLSLIVFSELLIIVAVDYPFTGSIKVEPTALARVLTDFDPAAASREIRPFLEPSGH